MTRLTIRDFQSYESAQTITFDPLITLLAGRNNVGKTALLRGIRHLVDGQPGAGPNRAFAFRWSMTPAELAQQVWLGDTQQVETFLTQLVDKEVVVFDAELRAPSVPTNLPTLDVGLHNYVGAQYSDCEFASLHVHESDLKLVPFKRSDNDQIVLWWENVQIRSQEPLFEAAQRMVQFVITTLSSMFYILARRNPEPKPVQQTVLRLSPDGENLTEVVETLYANERNRRFRDLEQFMSDVFPEIKYVEVHHSGNNPVTSEIHLDFGRHGGRTIPLRYCGTGIGQALVLATAVLTATTETCFLIDEPHAFLHPAAERGVLRFLRAHPEHQYIVATHSPAFLQAYPISHARLFTMEDDGSHINEVGAVGELLAEIGVTAADLWSAESILWMEGASDVAVAQIVVDSDELAVPVGFRAMPDAVRSSKRSENMAEQAVGFCRAVSEAILPVQVEMAFLFDGDEKKLSLKQSIETATGGRAHFLEVRELENLFLSPEVIHPALARLCGDVGQTPPTFEQVDADLDAILSNTSETRLYPDGAAQCDPRKVIGSEVLRRLYWKWAIAEYDKVRDGVHLAREAKERSPERLEPLLKLVRTLGARTS